MREADFSERIKTILCERVGGRCSNPNCRRETLGPHREGDKRLSIGEAAHILGASPKGARYDARMTKEERESINNGIWLCSACHTLIDKNPDEYPVEELLKWKMIAEYEQERRLKGEDIVSFQSQQMERKKEALKQVKYATDCLLNVEKSTGKKDIAVEYLQKLLSVEDLASTYIYEKMKEYGIAKRTVQEAKKIAEIKAYKKGKNWYWHMEVGDSI